MTRRNKAIATISLVGFGTLIGASAKWNISVVPRDTPDTRVSKNAIRDVAVSRSGAGVVLLHSDSNADGISVLDSDGKLVQTADMRGPKVAAVFPLIKQQPVMFLTRENGAFSIPLPAGERAELARSGTLPETESDPLDPGEYQVIAVSGDDVVGRKTLHISESEAITVDKGDGDCIG